MAGDVDQLPLTGKSRTHVMARPLLERRVVGALHEDHVQPNPADLQTADGVAGGERAPEDSRIRGNLPLGDGQVAGVRRRPIARAVSNATACRL